MEHDLRDLFVRYLAHVRSCEGVTFVPGTYEASGYSDVSFSEQELATLQELHEESKHFNHEPKS